MPHRKNALILPHTGCQTSSPFVTVKVLFRLGVFIFAQLQPECELEQMSSLSFFYNILIGRCIDHTQNHISVTVQNSTMLIKYPKNYTLTEVPPVPRSHPPQVLPLNLQGFSNLDLVTVLLCLPSSKLCLSVNSPAYPAILLYPFLHANICFLPTIIAWVDQIKVHRGQQSGASPRVHKGALKANRQPLYQAFGKQGYNSCAKPQVHRHHS